MVVLIPLRSFGCTSSRKVSRNASTNLSVGGRFFGDKWEGRYVVSSPANIAVEDERDHLIAG